MKNCFNSEVQKTQWQDLGVSLVIYFTGHNSMEQRHIRGLERFFCQKNYNFICILIKFLLWINSLINDLNTF